MSNQHEYTVEILYHFTCEFCSHWWSYAVTPFVQPVEIGVTDKRLYCPHCGHTQTAKIKDGYWLEKNPDYQK
jgi:transcription elongation factor Elf1